MANSGFRYTPDVRTATEPWREQLGHDYESVVARLVDRDRALEDYVNQVIYDRVNALVTFGGGETSNLGAWTDYVPTLTQGATVTKTTNYSRYRRSGRQITVELFLVVTGAGTAGNVLVIGLPVAAFAAGPSAGVGVIFDASAGLNYGGVAAITATTTVSLLPTSADSANYLGASVFVAALAVGDVVLATLTYEAAS
jgi:hypothetical protein